jgi:hypothetical protein
MNGEDEEGVNGSRHIAFDYAEDDELRDQREKEVK